MPYLYTMIGLPGAGKSTIIKNKYKNYIVVCPDDIRAELFGDANCQKQGDYVFTLAHQRIEQALAQGFDVVFDATNTQKRYRKDIFKKHPNATHVAVYVSTPIETCKKRNAARNRVVPEEVIDRMAKRLDAPTVEEGFSSIVYVTNI